MIPPRRQRSLKVAEFIRICKSYAKDLIPEQDFRPESRMRIRAAEIIDNTFVSRELFHLFKRISS